MKIWDLSLSAIDFTPFYLPEEGKSEKFLEFADALNDTKKHISSKWEPLVLLKSEQMIDPDFFDIYDSGSIIVSSGGKDLLEVFLNDTECEFLPFMNDESEYFLFNLIKTIDCLDKEKSVFEELNDGIITEFEALVFDYKKIESNPIFRIPELPYAIFATHIFQSLYDESGLKGIDFDEENIVFVD